jgi:hypothetical protein
MHLVFCAFDGLTTATLAATVCSFLAHDSSISGCCEAYLFFIAAAAAVIATDFLVCGGVLLHFATSSSGILQDQLHVDSVSTHSLRLLPPTHSLAQGCSQLCCRPPTRGERDTTEGGQCMRWLKLDRSVLPTLS